MDRMQLRKRGVSPMSHKDGNNHEGMAANSPWGMDHQSTNGRPREEVPILPVLVNFVRTTKYNIAMVSEFCWPFIKQ